MKYIKAMLLFLALTKSAFAVMTHEEAVAAVAQRQEEVGLEIFRRYKDHSLFDGQLLGLLADFSVELGPLEILRYERGISWVSSDDPRVNSKFAALGPMFEVIDSEPLQGVVWSGTLKNENAKAIGKTHQKAMEFCTDLGEGFMLPSAEDYKALGEVIGRSMAKYNGDMIPGMYYRFWTSSIADPNDYPFWSASAKENAHKLAYTFNGAFYCNINLDYRSLENAVRCIARRR